MHQDGTESDGESVKSSQNEGGKIEWLAMAYLIDKDDVMAAVDSIPEISGEAYWELISKIDSLPVQVVPGITRIQGRLSDLVDGVDRGIEEYVGVLREWVDYFKRSKPRRAKKRGRKSSK